MGSPGTSWRPHRGNGSTPIILDTRDLRLSAARDASSGRVDTLCDRAACRPHVHRGRRGGGVRYERHGTSPSCTYLTRLSLCGTADLHVTTVGTARPRRDRVWPLRASMQPTPPLWSPCHWIREPVKEDSEPMIAFPSLSYFWLSTHYMMLTDRPPGRLGYHGPDTTAGASHLGLSCATFPWPCT